MKGFVLFFLGTDILVLMCMLLCRLTDGISVSDYFNSSTFRNDMKIFFLISFLTFIGFVILIVGMEIMCMGSN